VIRTLIPAPLANSHIERQSGSARRECLDWILITNRRHPRTGPSGVVRPLQRGTTAPGPKAEDSDRAIRSGGTGPSRGVSRQAGRLAA